MANGYAIRTTLDGYKVVEKSITDSDYKEFCDANREPTLFGNVGFVNTQIPIWEKKHRLCADCEFIARKIHTQGNGSIGRKSNKRVRLEKLELFFWNLAMTQHKATTFPHQKYWTPKMIERDLTWCWNQRIDYAVAHGTHDLIAYDKQ